MDNVTKIRVLKLCIALGAAAIIVFIGFVIHWWNYPPLAEGDADLSLLEYTPPEIPEESNGARFVLQAIEAGTGIGFHSLKFGNRMDWAAGVNVLPYAQAIELLHQASEYDICRIPDSSIMSLPTLARAWVIQGAQASLLGDDAKAVDTYFHVFDFGSKLTEGHGTLITVLLGITLQGIALDAMREELQTDSLKASTLDDAITHFSSLEVTTEGLANALRIKYRKQLSSLAQMEISIQQNPFKRFFYDQQETRDVLDNFYARLIGVSLAPPSECYKVARIEEWERLESFIENDKGISRYFRRNCIGLLLFRFTVSGGLVKAPRRVHQLSWTLSATSALYRLKRFELAQGTLPQTLAELAAYDGLPIPHDPIADAPLGYSPADGVIYSTVRYPTRDDSKYRISSKKHLSKQRKPLGRAKTDMPWPSASVTPPDNPSALQSWTKLLPDSKTPLRLVYLPGGTFQMGDQPPPNDTDSTNSLRGRRRRRSSEPREVDGFWMAAFEITNAQYAAFVKATGHANKGSTNWDNSFGKPEHPVVNVSWSDAAAFCEWAQVRLPTEAEWEYAAHGGENFYYGTVDGTLDYSLANYARVVGTTTHVGTYPPNPFGLYDISGNVWEFCLDQKGWKRILCGGSWVTTDTDLLSSAGRGTTNASSVSYLNGGFRCAQ